MSSTQLVCTHCNRVNRLPADRLGDQPRCGNCHEPLFSAQPAEVTAAAFERQVNNSDIPVLVDCWAPWCGPCLAMAPAFEEAAARLEPAVRLLKLNTEEEQTIGARYDIRSIPTMLLFHRGKEIARQSGAMMAGDIIRWTQSNLP